MRPIVKLLALLAPIAIFSFANPPVKKTETLTKPTERKIQVAILLDVSGSMNGLIEQAKSQLWNMVNTLGKAKCDDNTIPKIELALYEYGRPGNGAEKGFVKQLSPFTTDLDEVSKILFGLTIDGGDEYCGQVIYSSLDELSWNNAKDSYKVIFIAGNEDFLQGKLPYAQACAKAKEKGVVVNTIYCGSYEMGIREHWNLLGECGNGSFTNINHNAREVEIPTPYDTTLIVLNRKLNATYIGYGAAGIANIARQSQVDEVNFAYGYSAGAKRAEAKAQSNVYSNTSWDMVDAYRADSTFITKLNRKELPDSLKNRSTTQLKLLIAQKEAERGAIQKEILTTNHNRSQFIAAEKARMASNPQEKTLETEVERAIRQQVQRSNMKID